MRYHEYRPAEPLARFIECFWTLEDTVRRSAVRSQKSEQGLRDASPTSRGAVQATDHQPERILPDGCVELILNFGDTFREHQENGRAKTQPRHFLVGQMTRAMIITANGHVELVGVRFHPGGTLPFFSVPMQEMTNQIVEMGALSEGLERTLVKQVGEASSLRQRLGVLESVLTQKVLHTQHDFRLGELTARIVRDSGMVSVDRLALDAGISSRQLERRFLRDVGVGPKLLCRILRFQQVFRAVEGDDSGWAGVAAACGYYDQAHLIKDFQQFAGQTPSLLFAQSRSLTELFTRKQRMSDFSNTPPAS